MAWDTDRMATKTASAGPASTIRRHFPHERGEALSAEADSIGITRHFPRERGEALSAKTARSRRPHGASAEPAWSQRPHGTDGRIGKTGKDCFLFCFKSPFNVRC